MVDVYIRKFTKKTTIKRLGRATLADFQNITTILGKVEHLAPSGFVIGFHLRLTSSEFLFQAYPRKWAQLYSERGFILSDPVTAWSFQNVGAIRWSSVKDNDPQDILGQAAEHGMKFGAGISVEAGTTKSIAGFARPDREYTDAELEELIENIRKLHILTTTESGMSEELHAELHRLSVKMTHPS